MAARKYRKLTEQEALDIATFAQECGRNWKKAVRQGWKSGFVPSQGSRTLAGLQRSHGETWLKAYRIEMDV